MRLSRLLRERKEAILKEFEDYARTHTAPGTSMDVEALRDHAAGMLEAMAVDLDQPQTEAEQERKGKGNAVAREGAARTAAEEHGLTRAESGFSMEETFAEYRALRASVMRLYVAARVQPDPSDVQDLIRFNETVDQALAEAITEYAGAVTGYREMALAVLGHDLRSPLNAIMNASSLLAEWLDPSGRDQRLARMIVRSATTMGSLIDDMLTYTSTTLGQGLSLNLTRADFAGIAAEVVHEIELNHPDREFRLVLRGDLAGEWDANRVRQGLSNLVTNAAQHAPQDSATTVTVDGEGTEGDVVAAIHNMGDPIPEQELSVIFQPFRRASTGGDNPAGVGGGAGLGLHIARSMAEAHGGTVTVESSAEAGTTFFMRLPRSAPAA